MPTVALAISGSIAAYKAVEVARRLISAGVSVKPVMTSSAERFVGPLTLSGICGTPVVRDMFDTAYPGEVHVDLGRTVDLVLIAPATADTLARMAQGRADDIVAALALSAACPVLVAPAMHTRMWRHPATKRNVATLLADGRIKLIGPVEGALASGESGMGRLADPADIAAAVLRELGATRDLAGLRVVVTAGPTVEDLDPVRFLSNRSSGRMGFAIAERAMRRGATVTLVAGPVELATPVGVTRVDVRSTVDMQAALAGAMGTDLQSTDVLIMAAAVADYAPLERQTTKIKKSGNKMSIDLAKNPDLLAEIGKARTGSRPLLVGSAVETAEPDELVAYAKKKLGEKKVDLVIANHAAEAFGGDTNRVTFVSDSGADALAPMTKVDLADRILDRVRVLAAARGIAAC